MKLATHIANGKPPVVSIYFAQSEESGLIKIGSSSRVTTRVRELAKKHGPLRILRVVPMWHETRWLAAQIAERHIHKRFAADRVFGEWFNPTAEILQFAQSDIRLIDGILTVKEGGCADVGNGSPIEVEPVPRHSGRSYCRHGQRKEAAR